MSTLVVRRLLVDMEQPIERHWCGGDAFRTAFFNALSMSFPAGEQFFVDSVRKGQEALAPEAQERFRAEARGFIGQEATHRRLHGLYNKHLDRLGLVNEWEPRIRERAKAMEGADVRHWLALTAATEHFTAIIADWMLHHPDWLGEQDQRLRTMWLWHSAEESEHRSTAIDVYRAVGGDEAWRRRWFRSVTLVFIGDTLRQTAANLRRDGTLWKVSTWKSAAAFFFGRQGLVRNIAKPWRDYLRSDFHPSQHDDSASRRWLAENDAQFMAVGG